MLFLRNKGPAKRIGTLRGAMISQAVDYLFRTLAATPFIYYLLVLFSTWRFFRGAGRRLSQDSDFTPPISNLKPLRGLDPEAYENLASYCRQDYPEYELIFCVGDENDPSVPVLEKLKHDFPDRQIRILFGSGRKAINDKVAKLVRMVTCLYVSTDDRTFTQHLHSIGMICDFFPGIFVARQLDGIKFAFGQTIVTTRSCLQAFGGYESIENRPADDLLVGRYIAQQGYEVELLPYAVKTVPDYDSFKGLFIKRLRWQTVMRHMRPWGHICLTFTQGLPWSLAMLLTHPADGIGAAYIGAYALSRLAITWLVGAWGLQQRELWKKMPLVFVWDASAFFIWLLSFGRRRIRWRNVDYRIRDGMLVPVAPNPASNSPR